MIAVSDLHVTPDLDIYTEPDPDPDTLTQLGPLAPLAGTWVGTGLDVHPKDPAIDPNGREPFEERYELVPIDPQTNGPQLLYGLRYHTRIVKPGEVEMFHEQVGFWLWEPAARRVTHTVAIPRGQVALASGTCEPDAVTFEVSAERGLPTYGIVSSPFLDAAFTTTHFRMTVTVNPDGTWSYSQTTRLVIPDRNEPYDHVDRNTLQRVAAPVRNPMAGGPLLPPVA